MSFFGADEENAFAEQEGEHVPATDALETVNAPGGPATAAAPAPLGVSGLAGEKRPREEEAVAEVAIARQVPVPSESTLPPSGSSHVPVSGYAFDDGDDGDGGNDDDGEVAAEEDTGIVAAVAGDNSPDGESHQPTNEEEGEAATDNHYGEGGDGTTGEVGVDHNEAENEEEVGEEGGGDDEDGGAEGENDGEESVDNTAEIALRLSELEATSASSSGRYSLELRVAEAEAAALAHFIALQESVLAAVAKEAEAAARASASSVAAPPSSVAPLTEERVRATVERDPRVAAALLRIAQATQRLRQQEARVTKLRHLPSDGRAASGVGGQGNGQPAPPLLPFDVTSMEIPRFEDTAKDAAASAAKGCSAVAGEVAVIERLLPALQYIPTREKRGLLVNMARQLQHLSQHNAHLFQYQALLAERREAIEDAEYELRGFEKDWALMAAQSLHSDDMALLGSASTVAELHVAGENAALRDRLTTLQTALAAIVAARAAPNAAPTTGTTTSATAGGGNGGGGHAVNVPVGRLAGLRGEVDSLEKMKEELLRELLFLRRQARQGMFGSERLTGNRLDLLIDGKVASLDGGVAAPVGGDDDSASTILPTLTEQLLLDSHAKVADVLRTVSRPSESEGQIDDAQQALSAKLMELQAQVASQHAAMAALVASNSRLAQSIQSVEDVGKFASDPEKATMLAKLLLARFGCLTVGGGNEEVEDGSGAGQEGNGDQPEEGGDEGYFLSAIERRVLGLYKGRVDALQSAANAHLATMNSEVYQPLKADRTKVALLARLLLLRDSLHMLEACHRRPSTTALVGAICDLDDAAKDVASATLSGAGAPTAFPVLPPSSEELHETFYKAIREAIDKSSPEWERLQTAGRTVQEELDWYAQFAVEDIDAKVTEAEATKKTLLQQNLDAAKRSQSAKMRKLELDKIQSEVKAMAEKQRDPLQAKLEQLTAQLDELKQEYEQKRLEAELARTTADAERQLEEQRVREEEAERQRQQAQQEAEAAAAAAAAEVPTLPSPVEGQTDAVAVTNAETGEDNVYVDNDGEGNNSAGMDDNEYETGDAPVASATALGADEEAADADGFSFDSPSPTDAHDANHAPVLMPTPDPALTPADQTTADELGDAVAPTEDCGAPGDEEDRQDPPLPLPVESDTVDVGEATVSPLVSADVPQPFPPVEDEEAAGGMLGTVPDPAPEPVPHSSNDDDAHPAVHQAGDEYEEGVINSVPTAAAVQPDLEESAVPAETPSISEQPPAQTNVAPREDPFFSGFGFDEAEDDAA